MMQKLLLPLDPFLEDLDVLGKEAHQIAYAESRSHFFKIEAWRVLCYLVGYGTAWIYLNPISILLISLGRFSSWTILAHHVLHGGYDSIHGMPSCYTRKGCTKGIWKLFHWYDWIDVKAWKVEHNQMHHYHLGERLDPDVPEANFSFVRDRKMPKILKYVILFVAASTWKMTYYAISTYKQLLFKPQDRKLDRQYKIEDLFFTLIGKKYRGVWLRCWIPYAVITFGVLPACFLPLGVEYYLRVLGTSLLAEWLTNIHSFMMIVPNHTGSDIHRFDTPTQDKKEFYVRQFYGTSNYRCGGDLNDFLHGWLNYQIEHHLWPDLTLKQYQLVAPKLKALCHQYNVPYLQESIWIRNWKMAQVFTGKASMLR